MLRGPLHDRGPDGRCTACGKPFPCPTGLAIYNSVMPRAEGKYRVRFVKDASSRAVDPSGVWSPRTGDEAKFFWRLSTDPRGDGCYEHFDNKGAGHEAIRAHFEANRHPGSWWSSFDIDGAHIFSDCQVEVLDGPLSDR